MPHLVAAPDKFRGTLSAAEVAAAAAGAARAAGWTADEVPMSDGGEGLLEALGGPRHTAIVTGPLGPRVEAEWRMLGPTGDDGRLTAVVEMSRAAGRALLPHPRGDDPVRATTTGVGQLLLAARDAGARRIVIGCGGSATTDGGLGAYEAVGSPASFGGVELVLACDVTTRFDDAAAVFGPQKGATPVQVMELGRRLVDVAARYRRETGVDVTAVPGGGAAGGLAGGLVALGPASSPGSPSWPRWSAWPDVCNGPIWRSRARATSTRRPSTGRCRAVCSSWPGPVAPRRRPPGPVHRGRRGRVAARLATAGSGGREPDRPLRRARARGETAALINQVTGRGAGPVLPLNEAIGHTAGAPRRPSTPPAGPSPSGTAGSAL